MYIRVKIWKYYMMAWRHYIVPITPYTKNNIHQFISKGKLKNRCFMNLYQIQEQENLVLCLLSYYLSEFIKMNTFSTYLMVLLLSNSMKYLHPFMTYINYFWDSKCKWQTLYYQIAKQVFNQDFCSPKKVTYTIFNCSYLFYLWDFVLKLNTFFLISFFLDWKP